MGSVYLVGSIVYGGQLGTRWRQVPALGKAANGEWLDGIRWGQIETRVDAFGKILPTTRYE
ncbi:hypothetical protein [Methylobacterium sp. SD21]|uniref:hypothetical protein n=1 Tax=Methylobacterium litchii TaxID=3138810 RepID=UPI00313AB0E2